MDHQSRPLVHKGGRGQAKVCPCPVAYNPPLLVIQWQPGHCLLARFLQAHLMNLLPPSLGRLWERRYAIGSVKLKPLCQPRKNEARFTSQSANTKNVSRLLKSARQKAEKKLTPLPTETLCGCSTTLQQQVFSAFIKRNTLKCAAQPNPGKSATL